MKVLPFPFLKDGQKVALVSPAAPVQKSQVAAALAFFESRGIETELGKHAFSDAGLVAASVSDRLDDLLGFLSRDDIGALWCLRGGYGSIQLLEHLDYGYLRERARLLIGFSDITALQWAQALKSGLPSLSGFTLTSQFHPANPHLEVGLEILRGSQTSLSDADLSAPVTCHCPGEVSGLLLGGNLAMICSLIGTPYWPRERGLVLFLEDINEPLYRIDRMIHQLALTGFWEQVGGLVLGDFRYHDRLLDVLPLFAPHLAPETPLVSGLPYGHFADSIPVPLGLRAHFSSDPFQLRWTAGAPV